LAKDVLVIGNFTTQGNQVVFGAINNVDAPNGFEAVRLCCIPIILRCTVHSCT
jgi:hypothetical protein